VDAWRFLIGYFLQIIGHDEASDGPLGLGDTNRAVHEMAHLRSDGGHVNVITSDIFEKRNEIDLLLIIATHRHARLLADDRDDALMVHFRSVIKTVEQMDRTRPTGG
jgi:hypothetical protein